MVLSRLLELLNLAASLDQLGFKVSSKRYPGKVSPPPFMKKIWGEMGTDGRTSRFCPREDYTLTDEDEDEVDHWYRLSPKACPQSVSQTLTEQKGSTRINDVSTSCPDRR